MAVTLDLAPSKEYLKALQYALGASDSAYSGWEGDVGENNLMEDEFYRQGVDDLSNTWAMDQSPMQQAAMMRAFSGGDMNPANKNYLLRAMQSGGSDLYRGMTGLRGASDARKMGYRQDLSKMRYGSRDAASQAALSKVFWGARRKPSTWDEIRSTAGQLGGLAIGAYGAGMFGGGGDEGGGGGGGGSKFGINFNPQIGDLSGQFDSYPGYQPANTPPPPKENTYLTRKNAYGKVKF